MARQIEINYKNESGYEVLYPNVQVNNIIDLETWMGQNYYSKSEADEKFATQVQLNGKIVIKEYMGLTLDSQGSLSLAYDKIPLIMYYMAYKTGEVREYSHGFLIPQKFSGLPIFLYRYNPGTMTFSNYTAYEDQIIIQSPFGSGGGTIYAFAVLFY